MELLRLKRRLGLMWPAADWSHGGYAASPGDRAKSIAYSPFV